MSPAHERIGFHYYPDDRHYTQADLQTWLVHLQGLRARWLTLRTGLERAVPETFIRGLLDAGIEPLIHLQAPIGRATEPQLAPLLGAYGRWGVHYVVVFDRPNTRAAWPSADWAKPGLVERFADGLLPVLLAQRSAGLKPTLPPLQPGGDYWDTAFLGALLDALTRRGQEALLTDLTLAIYAWTHGKAVDWGAGGPARWSEARPYHTPDGCQDQCGLRACDWYAAAAGSAGLESLPMIVIAGGVVESGASPALGPDPHTEQNLAVARALLSGDLPPYVRSFAFYPLVTEPGHPDHGSAWFVSAEKPRPIVASLERLLDAVSKGMTPGRDKPLKHYLLLPAGSGASWLQEWNQLADFTSTHQPAVGFSFEEARLAQRVTIAGGEDVFPRALEQDLRAAGCEVDRIVARPTARMPESIPLQAGGSHE